jgi:tetratricopeptide (TPR) repeat protein
VHTQLGTMFFKRGLYANAEIELKRAIELDPDDGNGYFYRGESLNQLGRVDEALEALERAVQLQPDNARAYYVMGLLFDRKGWSEQAIAMYRKAREVPSK